MFRLNRGRIIGLLLSTFIIYFLFLSSSNTNSEFRKRTEEGLSRRHGILQGELSDEDYRSETNQRLNDILSSKDGKTGQKPLRVSDEGTGPAPSKPQTTLKTGSEHEEEASDKDDGADKYTGVAGRKTMQKPKDKPRYPVDTSDEKQESLKKASPDDDDAVGKKAEPVKPKTPSDPGKDLAREKMQEYMKKPLIIFSKSYCPHSKRAKELLLEMYTIIPTPLVVELDHLTERVPPPSSDDDDDEDDNPRPQPTLGQKIQELLAEITSRRTVPNIVVGTTSIGGNDLIWAMHEKGTLAAKIKELGGRRIVSVEPVVDESEDKD